MTENYIWGIIGSMFNDTAYGKENGEYNDTDVDVKEKY